MSFVSDLNQMNHTIPWQQAITMVNLYNSQMASILSGGYGSAPDTLLNYETFNLACIQAIVVQPGAAGFRIYMGMDTLNRVRCIMVACDSNGHDVIMDNGNNPLIVVKEVGQRHP
jgi:hypothetical protein